jgi:phosphotransferase system enzyme I (PtsI)
MKITDVPPHSVVFVHELTPSEIIEASHSLTFVTFGGGVASHAAIIARAKETPCVTNIDMKMIKAIPFDLVIVDGSEGIVILNPTEETIRKYQEIKKGYLESYQKLKTTIPLKAETIDGYSIHVFANLETSKEVDLLIKNGGSGVGLFRSEYLFLSKGQFPTEEEQFDIYKKIAKSLRGLPLVIRVFDVGGEKKADLALQGEDRWYFMDIRDEPNPALGCRGIRFLLRYPQILRAQIRAILRSSAFGDIRILIPMVSDLEEVRSVKAIIQQVKGDLITEGIPIGPSIQIGCMIEVPSSALICDQIAEEVDFLSIGTNDLIQYTLAADRSNHLTSGLYLPIHPSIVRLIQMIITSANQARKPLVLCGESAADPLLIPLFIGLGIREFSVAVRHIPILKYTIRKWRITEAHRLAYDALQHASSSSLKELLLASSKEP